MGFAAKNCCSLLCVMVLLPLVCYSQDAYVCSGATYYAGAWQFGEYGRTVYNGGMSGVSRLYRNGTDCGACYQVRCKVPQLCTEDGADCQQWRGMRKAYSAVWDMANPPAGALNFRVQVSGSAGLKKVQLTSVIPSEWKAGPVYDTTIQLT
ncbi:hypothetical protein ACSBR2_023070 [Camellia fascicularis]